MSLRSWIYVTARRRHRHQSLQLLAFADTLIFQPLNSCRLVLLNKLLQIIAELSNAVELTVCGLTPGHKSDSCLADWPFGWLRPLLACSRLV